MSLVGRKVSREKDPLITFTLPKKIADYISLWAVYKGRSRASIVRDMVVDWYEDNSQSQSSEVLLEDISQMLFKVWKTRRRLYKNFEEYLDHVEDELTHRHSRIKEFYTTTILNKLHDLHAAEQ